MFPFLFSLFSHLRSQYRLVAYGPTLLAFLGLLFFFNGTENMKLLVFVIIAGQVSYITWKLLRDRGG